MTHIKGVVFKKMRAKRDGFKTSPAKIIIGKAHCADFYDHVVLQVRCRCGSNSGFQILLIGVARLCVQKSFMPITFLLGIKLWIMCQNVSYLSSRQLQPWD